jgi:asparagine synthase (glutamine-hydrolysing)
LRRAGEGLARAVAADFQERWSNARFEMSGSGRVEDLQVGDLTRFSLPSLLRYEDRNSMAFGIEARLPFLDYRFAEFMLALAPEMKLRNGQTKAPLREAFRGVVPDAVLDRRDKLGFAPPQSRWLKGPFGRMMRDRFESDSFRLRKLVDPTQVAALMDGSGGFARAHESQAFRVYSLDAWAEAFDVSI